MLESATIKRTIICGLVLMTSLLLIILTIAAVPFVNMKVFTNAMAVVIDPSINDTSQNHGGYPRTLKNDNNNNKYQLQSNNNDNNAIMMIKKCHPIIAIMMIKIANIQPEIKYMYVNQAHLKDSL